MDLDNHNNMNYLAQDFGAIQGEAGYQTPGSNVGEIITATLPWIFGIAGIILLLNIISSGFKMMTSQGDPKALQGAQGKLTTSAIGIVILFTSFWIVKIIMQFFGLNMDLFN